MNPSVPTRERRRPAGATPDDYLWSEAWYQSHLRSPLMLLNQVFGQWTDHGWQRANLEHDQVDLTHIASALNAANLTDKGRVALRLRFLQGCTFKEIGKHMGFSAANARDHVAKGVRRLRAPYNLNHFKRAIPGWFNLHRL